MAKNTLDETKEIKILLSQIRALSDTYKKSLTMTMYLILPDMCRIGIWLPCIMTLQNA